MKLTSALLVPFLVLASNVSSIAGAPHPEAAPAGGEENVKSKIALLSGTFATREPSLEARGPVTGTVTEDNVRYRRCPRTSCDPVGQYHTGRVITIVCRTPGDSVNGWTWWDLMDNGFYISDYYVAWTGGAPDIC